MTIVPMRKSDIGESLALASATPFWLDTDVRPAPRPRLSGDHDTDLAVVGGGFSGLWTALLAKERNPDRRVILVEGERIGWAASGRNGGFAASSLTHGRENGASRFPDEIELLDKLGVENLNEMASTLTRYGIDCNFERTGTISVALQPYQVESLRGAGDRFLDRDQVRARLNSPTYLAGAHDPNAALIDPARLAWGLAQAADELGVTIAEHTRITAMTGSEDAVELTTATGSTIRARQVALGTNAFTPLLRRLKLYTVPVYDYVLVTEPLTDAQMASIGWDGREGFDDTGNQFHYYRLTADNRILWGGYDAIYHFGRHVRVEYDQRPETFAKLAGHFFTTFPQLAGLSFTHAWGGAIDTCTRFFAFFGTALQGKVAYALGYTGLGVAATRFGANVMLDLLSGEQTERTQLQIVRRRPLPFPPEPVAWLGIQATRAALARADEHAGHRNLWLRTLDRFGLGFDS